MNPNIKKINEHTVAVNYGLAKAGMIYGINLIGDSEISEKSIVSLSGDGVIVLNTQSDFYSLAVFIFPIIQLDNNYEFNRKMKYIEQKLKSDMVTDYDKVYALFLSWDSKRRELFKKSKRKVIK